MTCSACGKLRAYLLGVLVADDALADALAGGPPHETIRSRLGRAERAGDRRAAWWCRLLGVLFRNPNYCVDSILPGDQTP